ncbi:MAG TPA: type VI secretion system tip protein TssI/VgrG [Aliidongia sp.]|nr:type VI secretion system tip protein TssI/VgrG [Aliidongia sp.]
MAGPLQPLLLLTSPLGDDTLPIEEGTLHAVGLDAEEQISRPFVATITAVSTVRAIDPDELVYQPVGLTIRKQPHSDRFFNGIIRRMEAIGLPQRDRWRYRLEIVPRLWFLSQSQDCRIFQQKTAVDILQTLFAEHQISPVDFRIFGDKPVREYTTQYNETDLDFVHRLLQESGYFYYFEHTKTEHTLIVTDRNQPFKQTDHPIHWVIHAGNNIDVFDRWSEALETAYGEVQLQDYDPTKPSTPVQGQQTTTLSTAGAAKREVFHWPAMTFENQIANDRARFRIEASEAAAELQEGHGYDSEFCPGRRFTLAKDPFTEAESIDYALHGVRHTAIDETWITGAGEPHYENHFTCFLQSVPWREPLDIPRPAMAGIFSAIVLGDAGEEIHADPIGRIKVRLLFDYRKETVASMAIWARVMQPWSGNTWGWQHLPRVGTEVAVSFMNGDPDAPVVVGCFYNQEMRPVFQIPDQQTRQGFRSRSTLKGTTQEFSELSFDDKKGSELVYLHAQKDYNIEVENNETVTVDCNYSLTTKTGDITVTADLGAISLTAARSITLRVGASLISMLPTGIEINAPTVTVTAETTATVVALEEVTILGTNAVNIVTEDMSIIATEFVAIPFPDLPA